MFRSRTDQVYATLQQVQRRISEQSGQPPAVRPAAPAVRGPLSQTPLSSGGLRPPGRISTPLPELLSQPPVGTQQQFPQPAQPGIFLSSNALVTVALLFIGCCLGFFFLGKSLAGPTAAAPSTPVANERREPDEPVAKFVLVIKRDQAATLSTQERYKLLAKQCNDWLARQPGGWEPQFNVRQTNDGIQLIYGSTAGIPRSPRYGELAALLAQPNPKGLGAQPTWESIAQ